MTEALYGRNAVYEALRAGRRTFHKLTLAEGVRESEVIDQILTLAEDAGIRIEVADRSTVDRSRVDGSTVDRFGPFNHQGVVLETGPYRYESLENLYEAAEGSGRPPLFLLLDLLKDPHNVGSLLRTAEAVGVHGVIIQERRAVDVTPTVVHTSVGAVEHLRVAQVTNLVRAIEWLKEQRVWIVGMEAVPGAEAYFEADLTLDLGIVVGSEGQGMRRLVRESCDFLVRLPMRGQVTSLNASVAGSILLYEALRQREVW